MNCMKMYALGITPETYLSVRDHKIIGKPLIFWTHNLKRESKDEVIWKVATSNDEDGIRWVLKKSGPLDYDLNANPEVPDVGLIYPACEGSPTCNTMNETIKTCMDIVGMDSCTQLIDIAVKHFKEHEDK